MRPPAPPSTAAGAAPARSRVEPVPLYARALGTAAARLAPRVSALHVGTRGTRARGTMDVHRGSSPAARLCCALLRLPAPGRDVPITLEIRRHGDAERWWRRFGDDPPLASSQHLAADGALVETYGPFELRFSLSSRRAGLQMRCIGARVWLGPVAVPLPTALVPTVHAAALPTDHAAVQVRVRISAPVIGPLLAYHGEVEQEEDHA